MRRGIIGRLGCGIGSGSTKWIDMLVSPVREQGHSMESRAIGRLPRAGSGKSRDILQGIGVHYGHYFFEAVTVHPQMVSD